MARKTPELDASSMADIAFLLLIFFLVTTTMEVTTGINRKLPPPPEKDVDIPDIKDRNIMNILISRTDRMLVNGKPGSLETLTDEVKAFMTPHYPDDPNYPETKLETIDLLGEVHKSKGIISLKNDRGTSYDMYIQVQDKLAIAFSELKNDFSQKRFGKNYKDLNEAQAKAVGKAIPVPVSEAEPENIGNN